MKSLSTSLLVVFALGCSAPQSNNNSGVLNHSSIDLSKCGDTTLRQGFVCIANNGNPVQILSDRASETDDPCTVAKCPEGLLCQSVLHQFGERKYLLPHCYSPLPSSTPPAPMRDPCAQWKCPAGYQCTAPADDPYCIPTTGNW